MWWVIFTSISRICFEIYYFKDARPQFPFGGPFGGQGGGNGGGGPLDIITGKSIKNLFFQYH